MKKIITFPDLEHAHPILNKARKILDLHANNMPIEKKIINTFLMLIGYR